MNEFYKNNLRRAIAESSIANNNLKNKDIDVLVDLFDVWLERNPEIFSIDEKLKAVTSCHFMDIDTREIACGLPRDGTTWVSISMEKVTCEDCIRKINDELERLNSNKT